MSKILNETEVFKKTIKTNLYRNLSNRQPELTVNL